MTDEDESIILTGNNHGEKFKYKRDMKTTRQ